MNEDRAIIVKTYGNRTLEDDTLRIYLLASPQDAEKAYAGFGRTGTYGAIAILPDEDETVSDAFNFYTGTSRTLADNSLKIQIDIAPDDASAAYKLFGRRGVNCVISLLAPDAAKPETKMEKKYGQYWRQLISSDVFNALPVLQAIGSESEFENFIRESPSVLSKNSDWDETRGEGRNQVCHVLRVSEGSGKAIKSPYCFVPMTGFEHRYQHDHGYTAAVKKFGSIVVPKDAEKNWGIEWMMDKVQQYRRDWASMALAIKLAPGCSSRAQVNPDMVQMFFKDHDLIQYLPMKLRSNDY